MSLTSRLTSRLTIVGIAVFLMSGIAGAQTYDLNAKPVAPMPITRPVQPSTLPPTSQTSSQQAPVGKPAPSVAPATPVVTGPSVSAPVAPTVTPISPAPHPSVAVKQAPVVDVNSATEAEMIAALKNIGPARAKAIVENRPYIYKKDLVSKAGIPQSYFDEIEPLVGLVNINKASAMDMVKIMDGIGQARADAIIKARPYKKTDELVTKGILPQSVFETIKNEIVVK